MRIKTGLSISLVVLSLMGLVSCWGTSDNPTYEVSTDAQLISFAISHDTLTVLSTAKFSIDQAQNLIYNRDSLPYLTDTAKIASRAKVAYTAGSGLSTSARIEYLSGDTAWVASGDTLLLAPQFYLRLYALSGNSKTYTVSINMHQIDPDSVQYQPVDASAVPITTTPDWDNLTQHCPDTLEVEVCLGFLLPDEQKGLALIVKDKDDLRFAFSDDLITYRLGSLVPSDFPVSGFSTLNDRSFGVRLTVIASLQSVWATENGLYWAHLFDTQADLPVIEGGNAIAYNDEIWFLNGRIATGEYNPKVYYSRNGGIVWEEKPSKTYPPAEFPLRQNATVAVDALGRYFYIVGGQNQDTNTPLFDDVWQVALNSRLFDR
jgi:hypothetical protein